MAFRYNAKGIKENGNDFTPIPRGTYLLKIDKATDKNKDGFLLESKNGNTMVNVQFSVVNGPHAGRKLFHNVVFMKDPEAKGAGMAIHFLKVIGEPWEDEFDVIPERWEGRKLSAYVVIENYQGKDGNKIKGVDKIDENDPFAGAEEPDFTI